MSANIPFPSNSNLPGILMSPETDALFRKWLKLQIASMYWGMIFKIVMFVLIAGSIIFSTITLAPIVEQQLSVLMNLQRTVSDLSGTSKSQTNSIPANISDIIKQLAPQAPLSDELKSDEEIEPR